jgi:DUF4097 and DUF4098 domain-containing protein YvlB
MCHQHGDKEEGYMRTWNSRIALSGIVFALVFLPLNTAAFGGNIEDTIEKSFTVKPGGTLTVDTRRGSIEVEGTSGSRVEVTVIREARTNNREKAAEMFEKFPVDFDQRGNDVFVTADYRENSAWKRFWNNLGNKFRAKFIIKVPEVYNVDLKTSGGSITVGDLEGRVLSKTSGGSLNFDNIAGDIDGRTSGGSVRIGEVYGDSKIHTSGGSITIDQARGTVDAHTSGGSISVHEVMGAIRAETSGGSVTAYLSRQPEGPCRLTTSGGTVTVTMAEDIGVDLDARTSGGSVRTDFPVTVRGEIKRSSLKAKVNGGGPELYLRSSGGSINLKRK